ncbi:MAG: PQQ-like beta-propeller repeat protein, partial [Cyclobacteriaceae bacterium]|nr:PQQ-like beta-propeller repeat protein [Cyclobacteriaceae bacterium]
NKLTAYKSENGETLWTRDLMKDFDAEMPIYGFTESVLIDGDNLYTRPAGGKGFQVCLNKTTGETVWVNNDIPGKYTYNSPVLHDFGGYRQLISASSSCYYGVDTKTGKLLWKVDFENQYGLNCVDAIPHNDQVFMSNGAGGGSMLIKLIASGDKITTEKVWFTDLMDNYHGGVLYHDGYFYGSGDRKRGWYAIESTSGEIVWSGPKRTGSLTYADGMLYLYNDNGSLLLVKASPDKYEQTGELKIQGKGPGPHWAHPVVLGGRLYVRYVDQLFVYDIGSK